MEELAKHLSSRGEVGGRAQEALLAYHQKAERVLRIRRGLYAAIPPGADSNSYPVDPFLVAAKLTPDAVLSHHTALEFQGKAYSVHIRFTYSASRPPGPLIFRSHVFRGAKFPLALVRAGKAHFAVSTAERSGQALRVATLERTLVDVLDHHELAAGKLAALLAPKQARDLFDGYRVLQMDYLEPRRLSIGFVVYGAMNRKDWRTVSADDVDFDAIESARQLIPTLRLHWPELQVESTEYGARLVKECRKGLSAILPFSNAEREFLNLLLDHGEIDSTILTTERRRGPPRSGNPL